jgi:peptidoglycan/xylan/chitin deacetylase (PgdA/CDA1 family)
VVISFDNGYRSQYTEALPVLRRLRWPAVENLQFAGLPPSEGGLLPREIRALVRDGWEIDTQGYSHADLTALGPASLSFQIDGAKLLLERRYGVDPHWFCYPSGRYDAAVVAAVRAAGFVGATTVTPGWAAPRDDLYALPRLRVLAGTTGAGLLALVRAWHPA